MAPGSKTELRSETNCQPKEPSNEGDAIKVFVRIRPPTEGSGSADGEQNLCLSVLSSTTLRLHSNPEPKTFTFDHVADMDTTQESVFSTVAKGIVESCMSGYNGTIFAYGQTGSGKTFTMMGPSESDNFTHNLRGVIPRSFEYLFSLIDREKDKAGAGKSFLCKCSFIEIYNEQIYDLLDSASAGLYLREHIKKGVFVVGAVEQVVTTAAGAYQVLSGGWRNRRVASTSMNRESSRSHAVFTITVESMEKSSETVNIRTSLLNLVDLAGSERQKDTHTEGMRLKEAGNINRSLSCLGQVITALVDVGNGKQRHVCYRDSKLTFLLRDSLGGNARTAIVANVHPGSRCFGETLSTLNFAQRAKLIKNKAVVNEDTQGNVSQLQAEVKRLKEQLAQLSAGHTLPERFLTRDKDATDYMKYFQEAMLFFKKSEQEKKSLVEKVTQLEDLTLKKERFIQSNKMIVKFREDQIMRLEKLHKESRGSFLPEEQDRLLSELRDEIQTLREQIEHHPRVAKYAMENHSLREENRRLRLLEPVKRAQEMDAKAIAKLEKTFLEVSGTEQNDKSQQGFLPKVAKEPCSLANTEKLKAQLLQIQSELNNSKQEYEEFKELTRKRQLELESELQSLQKANLNLENLLEATKACKRQEVSQLNKLHAETLKIITTPTKAYQLWSRPVPKLSPETGSFGSTHTQNSGKLDNDILNEPVPPEMNEQAFEAISEELRMVQEQMSTLQVKLDEEEHKNLKLQQRIDKLEHHSTQMQELFSSERTDWTKQQQQHLSQLNALEKQLQDTQTKNDFLKSEVHDLRVVLHSADKELSSVKLEYGSFKESQEQELNNLSERHMHIQLQLDNVREILDVLEAVRQEKQKEMAKCEQQMAKVQKLEESLCATEKVISSLEKSRDADKEVVADLMSQIQELRTSVCEKTETIDTLKQELKDINCKYDCALVDKEESKVLIKRQEAEILDLKETLRLRILSEDIERDMLCEDLAHATEQLNTLTEASKKHSALLQSAQEELTRKEALIQELQQELNQKKDEVEQKKNEYHFKMRQLEHVMDSAAEYPQSPKTPPHFQTHLAKLLETQEREIEDGRASKISLQHLVTKLSEDREVKNAEILRMKEQLSEMDNLRLEAQQLREKNWLLQGQLDDLKRQKDSSEQDHPDDQQLKNEQEELIKERLAKNKLVEEMLRTKADLDEVQSALQNKETACLRMTKEVERTRTLESKAFQEKEQLRSKLEELYEERERTFQEMEVLRKQVECLAEENGKLLGHQNPNQKIHYVVRLRRENVRLAEETEKLRAENIFLKEMKKSF
ncbi:kinesin-like protein KIF15 isoform X3 [Molossus molossus]|uniref:kinesin-like protein KIF15 isoform X3 n=1 Tax=Molossus molossus TaxID=27622 RepID=UPI0017472E7B|nr:kinesin-like protein KIF15 isoform X3 [Molossus molossus]